MCKKSSKVNNLPMCWNFGPLKHILEDVRLQYIMDYFSGPSPCITSVFLSPFVIVRLQQILERDFSPIDALHCAALELLPCHHWLWEFALEFLRKNFLRTFCFLWVFVNSIRSSKQKVKILTIFRKQDLGICSVTQLK